MIYKFNKYYFILSKSCSKIIKIFKSYNDAISYINKNINIVKFKNKYYGVDTKCKKILGKFNSYSDALKRLKQIEYFKHK